MSSEPPPGPGQQPPEDDRFRKQPPPHGGAPPPPGGEGPHGAGGGPYDAGGGGPHGAGGGPYGGYPADPLAGMPPLADSVRRTLARIIDMILVGVVVALLSWGFGVAEYTVNADNVQFGKSFIQEGIAAVLYIGYDTVLINRTGQTLGKRWLGMRVANLSDGATPSVQTCLARAAVLWIPFAFCCACVWTAIAGGWSYFDRPYKQGLHDKAARTVVVSTG